MMIVRVCADQGTERANLDSHQTWRRTRFRPRNDAGLNPPLQTALCQAVVNEKLPVMDEVERGFKEKYEDSLPSIVGGFPKLGIPFWGSIT